MLSKQNEKQFLTGIPPWLFIGAIVILSPVFILMMVENIHRQKQNSTQLLREKGAALIRSFEAGTRTGMMGMHRGNTFKLQQLLTETAQLEDIIYLLVTDIDGEIRAHNDLGKIGKKHGSELDLTAVYQADTEQWRTLSISEEKQVFEVFRKFSPHIRPPGFHDGMRFPDDQAPSPGIIFVGLDMSAIDEARRADTRHTIIMGLILLLIGCAGILLLFMAHSYRYTRASLSRIKAFSDKLVENMPIGLIALDDRRKVIAVNQVAEKILKRSADVSIGKFVEDVLPKELICLFPEGDQHQRIVEKEVSCPYEHGTEIPLNAIVSGLTDEHGVFLGYVLLLKDLREVRALQNEIARSQRLASVGKLASGVAHEIRNPLSSIKGFATYFKERYRDIPEDQHISNIMIQEVDRLNRVIGQLLEFSRPIQLQKRRIEVKPLIENSIQLIEKQAKEKSIRIQTEISDDTLAIHADSDRMSQVLLNLYLNAIEAMDEGGVLTVSALESDDKKNIEIHIADNGVGISEDQLAHVFDPYFTTKSSGTGLGLAIVNNIIEVHGGKIRIDSRSGQGTHVQLFLQSESK